MIQNVFRKTFPQLNKWYDVQQQYDLLNTLYFYPSQPYFHSFHSCSTKQYSCIHSRPHEGLSEEIQTSNVIKWDNDKLILINCQAICFVCQHVNHIDCDWQLTAHQQQKVNLKLLTVHLLCTPYRPLKLYFLELFVIFPFNQCYLKTKYESHKEYEIPWI